ncbi:hypothetical protein [Sphingomonas yabuuchiae]|uniref:Uncharacterized protein n=1 Tax=Sphingomonas yabuuchiae TaxID=172044 RepID=A0AA41DB12_9SPHN|nr:hypothetical protein [Sphingomonas yabuuchiae]MBB4611420.1 hypothetical protein [Sphingomonas yabuuchiae]MBN3557006.1 hypothetical protein [Sphingomonas yabuuchiae]
MRDDYLASICVVDEKGLAATVPLLVELEAMLSRHFRYFEIVYVVSERLRDRLHTLVGTLAGLPNLRILVTEDSVSFYRQRAIAASEAIGDVVALYDLADVESGELIARMDEAKERNSVLLGWHRSGRVSDPAYHFLSLLSRNKVTARASRTIILSRERLNAILARGHASLDLRFEQRGGPARYSHFALSGTAGRTARLAHRYELLTEILRAGAPRYLKIYAVLGFLAATSAALYGLYAVSVLLTHDQVQEGWFSTAFILAGSMGFISTGMSILSIALAAILERAVGGDDRAIVDEIANISFFDRLTERNVEIGQMRIDPPGPEES